MNIPINARKLVSESLIIVLSVLFALFINEWRNTYNENKQTQIILENIQQEMQENNELTSSLLAYHSSVLQRVQNAHAQDSLELLFFSENTFDISIAAPYGIIQKDYKNIAWEVAKEEKISSRISFDKSAKLFEVYAQQHNVRETIFRLVSVFQDRLIHRKSLLHENVLLIISELNLLVGQEKYLLHKMETALNELNMKKSN